MLSSLLEKCLSNKSFSSLLPASSDGLRLHGNKDILWFLKCPPKNYFLREVNREFYLNWKTSFPFNEVHSKKMKIARGDESTWTVALVSLHGYEASRFKGQRVMKWQNLIIGRIAIANQIMKRFSQTRGRASPFIVFKITSYSAALPSNHKSHLILIITCSLSHSSESIFFVKSNFPCTVKKRSRTCEICFDVSWKLNFPSSRVSHVARQTIVNYMFSLQPLFSIFHRRKSNGRKYFISQTTW